MENIKKKIEDNFYFSIILISIFLFSLKWILSYFYFADDISLKIILDTPSDGFMYFTYLNALTSFDFNNAFDNTTDNLKNLPLPLSTILLPSILYKFFGAYSILIIELVFTFFYLVTFSLILEQLKFEKFYRIFLSLFLVSIPTLLEIFSLSNHSYIKVLQQLYDLRFPRPFLINIIFYFFIYFILTLRKNHFLSYKNMIISSLILSYSLTSFYYFFFIELIFILIFISINFKSLKFFSLENLKYFLCFIFVFSILFVPFLYFFFTAETDYLERIFYMDFDIEKKKILLSHIVNKIFSFNFIIIFIFITTINYFFRIKKIEFYEKLNLIYYLVISSILAPIFFILLANKISIVYHFLNLIVLCFFLYFLFVFFICVRNLILPKLKKYNFIFFLMTFVMIFIYNLNVFFAYKTKANDPAYVSYRLGLSNVINLIEKNNPEELSIITFDRRLMVWSIMNKVKKIKPLSGVLVPKTNEMIENDLIEIFYNLNLNSDNFLDYFSNDVSGWRAINQNTQNYFWGRYTASKLKTFENSLDFDEDILKIIQNTSPLNIQSIAIPNFELKRLKNKFENFKKDKLKNEIYDLYVIDIRKNIENLSYNSNYKYCKKFSNNTIKIYLSNKLKEKCEKSF